jgi:hypothetical protein
MLAGRSKILKGKYADSIIRYNAQHTSYLNFQALINLGIEEIYVQ